MKSTVEECNLILRRHVPGSGIKETPMAVTSLEQLYDYCVTADDPHVVERLLIRGRDEQGRRRLLAFSFKSVSDQRAP